MSFKTALLEVLVTKPNGNVEFSWMDARYNGHNLLPDDVREQEGNTCVFEAFSAGAEMAVRQDCALRNKSCDIRFSSRSLLRDYEEDTGRKLSEESSLDLPSDVRQKTVRRLFMNNGALATSSRWDGEQRIKMTKAHNPKKSPHFHRIADFIRQGRPVVGCIPVDEEFMALGPEEIYHYHPQAGPDADIEFSHYVLFVGYGYEGGLEDRPYLVFLNSHGDEFGQNGLAVCTSAMHSVTVFYVLTVKAPPTFDPGASSSSAMAAAVPTEESDRPRQRRRLNTDGGPSSSTSHH